MLRIDTIEDALECLENSKWHLKAVVSGTIELDYSGMRYLIELISCLNPDKIIKEVVQLRKLKTNIDALVNRLEGN